MFCHFEGSEWRFSKPTHVNSSSFYQYLTFGEQEKHLMVFGVLSIFSYFNSFCFPFSKSMLYMLLPLPSGGGNKQHWWDLMFIIIHKFCWFLFLSYLLFFLYLYHMTQPLVVERKSICLFPLRCVEKPKQSCLSLATQFIVDACFAFSLMKYVLFELHSVSSLWKLKKNTTVVF